MIRVLLVDDAASIRSGLRLHLAKYPDIDVVGEAQDGADAVIAARSLRPDVVVMDIYMPRLDGIEATRQIASVSQRTKIIGYSIMVTPEDIQMFRNAGGWA